MFPMIGGRAVAKQKWDHVLDWLAEHDQHEHSLALAWHVDGDTLQDYYDADLKAEGFYEPPTDKVCDCCGENIKGGRQWYIMTYRDNTTQQPMCGKCANEAMEEEARSVWGDNMVIINARVAAEQLTSTGLDYWMVLAWVIAQEVTAADLLNALEHHFNDRHLERWIRCNLRIGAAIW